MRTVYQIKDVYGSVIAEHVRIDWPGGKKRMYWQVPGGNGGDGLMGLSTPDLSLFGSESIQSYVIGQTVIIGEGERVVLTLRALGFDALGTVTGAGATPGEDALSPLIPFDVVLWPDHDREGYQHMNRVAWALYRLSGRMPRAIVPEMTLDDGTRVLWALPKGFDAADLHRNANRRAIVADLILAAQPWRLHREPAPVAKPVRPVYDRADDDQRVQTAKSHLLTVVEQKLGPPKVWRQGTPWWCCPFHADRSPSFKVDMREPFYRCFGCQARGDVFTFLRAIDGVEFKDVLRELAPAPEIRTVRVWAL